MTILVVHCGLNRSDIKAYKSRLSLLSKEIERGRRKEQISINGSVFFVQTPELAKDFTKRLIENCDLNREKDRLTVIDVSRGKAYVWGNFDSKIEEKFPLLILEGGA